MSVTVGDRGSNWRVTCSAALQVCATDVQCAQRTERGHGLRLMQLAAEQLIAVAQPLQGPVASARTCVPLRITIDHHRSKPSLEPILDRATKRRCFCGMLAAATTDPRRAALVCVPCPRWPTLIRRLGVACTPEKGSNRPSTASLARISDTAQSVRASDTSSCRYQHPPAPWQTSSGKKRTPLVL